MKKHLKLTSIQSNKFISDLPEKRAKIEASIAFRNNALESAKRTNYQLEYDRLHGLKDLNQSLISAKANKRNKVKDTLGSVEHEQNILAQRVPVIEKRMKELQKKAKLSLKGIEPHYIYKSHI
jgi:hypothetical protein